MSALGVILEMTRLSNDYVLETLWTNKASVAHVCCIIIVSVDLGINLLNERIIFSYCSLAGI